MVIICEVCGERLKNNGRYARHLMLHLRGGAGSACLVRCDLCGAAFQNERSLVQHKHFNHPEAKRYGCQFCGVKYSEQAYLAQHLLTHETPYKCKLCGAEILGKENVEQHIQSHSIPPEITYCGEIPYKCGFCGVVCTGKEDLDRHSKTHSGETSYKCGATFSEKENLEKPGPSYLGETYKCKICGAEFFQKGDLELHGQSHGVAQPGHSETLTKCGGVSSRKGNLGLQNNQLSETLYSESVCSGKEDLEEHSKIHLKPKPELKCQFKSCNVVCYDADMYKKHYQTHLKNKKCEICYKAFTLESGLMQHYLGAHKFSRTALQLEGRFPSSDKCDLCDKEFSRSPAQLIQHRLDAHTCPFCGAEIADKEELRSHVRCHAQTRSAALLGGTLQLQSPSGSRSTERRNHNPTFSAESVRDSGSLSQSRCRSRSHSNERQHFSQSRSSERQHHSRSHSNDKQHRSRSPCSERQRRSRSHSSDRHGHNRSPYSDTRRHSQSHSSDRERYSRSHSGDRRPSETTSNERRHHSQTNSRDRWYRSQSPFSDSQHHSRSPFSDSHHRSRSPLSDRRHRSRTRSSERSRSRSDSRLSERRHSLSKVEQRSSPGHSGVRPSRSRGHSTEMQYECELCGAAFSDRGTLQQHNCTRPVETIHKCEFCGVEFSGAGELSSHNRAHLLMMLLEI